MQRHFSFLLLIALSVAASGCGDGKMRTYPVSGTITYQGEPLAGATVGFSPKRAGEGDGGFARTDSNGFYQIQTTRGHVNAGTTPGEYYVTIATDEMVATKTFSVESEDEGQENETVFLPFPEKYSGAGGGTDCNGCKRAEHIRLRFGIAEHNLR